MKKLIIALAALAAAPGFAQAPANDHSAHGPAQTAATPDKDPDEVICRNIETSGTRLGRVKQCKTRAEWDAGRRRTSRDAEQAQARSGS